MPRFLGCIAVFCAILYLPAVVARADSPTSRPADVTVAVLPFEVLAAADQAWVGTAIGEGLADSIQRERGMSAVRISVPDLTDSTTAVSAGKTAQADFVILGTVQRVNDQLRVRGKIFSTANGKSVGNLSYDGDLKDLFVIEDTLASKVTRLTNTSEHPTQTVATPSFEIRGPTLPTPSRYFDGNLSAQLAIKPQFQDEADRYNYQPTQFYYSCYGCWRYGPWACGFGHNYFGTTAVTLSEW